MIGLEYVQRIILNTINIELMAAAKAILPISLYALDKR